MSIEYPISIDKGADRCVGCNWKLSSLTLLSCVFCGTGHWHSRLHSLIFPKPQSTRARFPNHKARVHKVLLLIMIQLVYTVQCCVYRCAIHSLSFISYKRRPIRDDRQIVDKNKRQGLAFSKKLRQSYQRYYRYYCFIKHCN